MLFPQEREYIATPQPRRHRLRGNDNRHYISIITDCGVIATSALTVNGDA